MGHSKKSEVYDVRVILSVIVVNSSILQTSYKSRFVTKDLGAVLHNRSANEQQLAAGEVPFSILSVQLFLTLSGCRQHVLS